MARNVEIKARLPDPDRCVRAVEEIADGPGVTLEQEDVFFHCDGGRLKLRMFPGGTGELIHYHRPDRRGPGVSDYRITRTPDPAGLRAVLERAFGVRAVVRKTRRLYRTGRTRIHLDSVEGLGDFLEIEVVLSENEDAAVGEAEARDLMARLGVDGGRLVSEAYVDLLEVG